MGVNKKLSSKKRKPSKKLEVTPEVVDSSEEIMECIDELFRYFDLTDDSYSEPPVIVINDGVRYLQGLVDTELHDLLMRLYAIVNKSQE